MHTPVNDGPFTTNHTPLTQDKEQLVSKYSLILRAYWPTVYKNRQYGIGMFLAMVLTVCLAGLYPLYTQKITAIFETGNPNFEAAERLFWQFVIVLAAVTVSYRLHDYFILKFQTRSLMDLDQRNLAVILRQPIQFFENKELGAITRAAERFTGAFETISDCVFREFGKTSCSLVVSVVVFSYGAPYMVIPLVLWLTTFLSIAFLSVRWKYPLDVALKKAESRSGGRLGDVVGNYHVVRSFGQEASEAAQYRVLTEEEFRCRCRSWRVSNLIGMIQSCLIVSAEMWIVWFMMKGWQKGSVTIAEFVFIQASFAGMAGYLRSFAQSLRNFFRAWAAAEEMAKMYARTPEVRDAPGAYPIQIRKGEVCFDHVNFSYPGTNRLVLNDFCLHIPAGQSVGIVGTTGAGKSTLIKLLLRHYDINSGSILVDCQDITRVTEVSLRQQMGLVPQVPGLFHRSVGANIGFGDPNATPQDIEDAARRAHALKFIEQLPAKFDTVIGERGVKISGGEAQRVTIARATLVDPPILILDEPTSSLDSKTERSVQRAIAEQLPGRTVIAIAHRLSTLKGMDRIVVLHEGKIIEDGTHDELLTLKGQYAELWNHQVGGYIA